MIDITSIYNRYLFLGLTLTTSLEAKTFEDLGHSFEIEEESFLTMIQRRVEEARIEGKLEAIEEDVKKRVKERVMNPVPVFALQKTTQERSWYFDPSITLATDIRDHKSRLVYPKGTKVNPLHKLSWGEPLILIDGSDEEQISWAINHVKEQGEGAEPRGKIVLTKGSPIQISRQTGQRFYFDQGGAITKKFQIKQVPARITQDGDKLLVEELRSDT